MNARLCALYFYPTLATCMALDKSFIVLPLFSSFSFSPLPHLLLLVCVRTLSVASDEMSELAKVNGRFIEP